MDVSESAASAEFSTCTPNAPQPSDLSIQTSELHLLSGERLGDLAQTDLKWKGPLSITTTAAQRIRATGSALLSAEHACFNNGPSHSSSSGFVKRLDGLNLRRAPKRDRR